MATTSGKTPRGLRNNNPCNIRISPTKFVGEIVPSQDSAFKQFRTIAHGYRAAFVTLRTYQRKHGLNTIAKIISRWAPPVENNTCEYIRTVTNLSGIPRDRVISTDDSAAMIPIVSAMSYVENGVAAKDDDVRAGWELFTNGN